MNSTHCRTRSRSTPRPRPPLGLLRWTAARAAGARRPGTSRTIGGLVAIAAGLLSQGSLVAQDDTTQFPGVRLGLVYESGSGRQGLAVKPFSGRFGGDVISSQVEAIIGRDLRYSDRFAVIDSLPGSMADVGVNYGIWDQLGAVYLVSGQVEGSGDGYVLDLEVHDVVYGQLQDQGRFQIPAPDAEHFRMAVHIASDAVVRWITGEPGMAASRIAFSREGRAKEVWVVDSDGENLQRVTRAGTIALSPTWAPDGRSIVYQAFRGDTDPRLYELDLDTGEERRIEPGIDGLHMTPSFHPDGQVLAFSVVGGSNPGIYTYNIGRNCCLSKLTGSRRADDLNPTFSPSGDQVAFESNRLAGTTSPQIHVMSSAGGEPDLVSPYEYGSRGYYTSPDWSPLTDRVVFHGKTGRTGRYQILVSELDGNRRRLTQLTAEGNNEDPSWAPDGRHVAFSGERSYGFGLMVVDVVTGATRLVVPSIRADVPSWSPSLDGPTQEALRAATR